MGRLEGKVAIVTGAARGMGAATATLFAAEGAKVVIADVLDGEGEALAASIGKLAHYHHLDVSQETQWQEVVADAERRFGTVDVLVNNAGILINHLIVDFPKAEFDRLIAINLGGTFLGMKHAGQVMRKRQRGSIVNISSTEGLEGMNAQGAYAASKWGVRGMTKVAAMEMSPWGVRVNSVHPGPVNTPMGNPSKMSTGEINALSFVKRLPIQRYAEPEEIARVSLFLASDDSSYVTGAEIAADGGMTVGQYLEFLPGAPGSPT